MENIFCQFEIRFTKILDFNTMSPHVIKDLVHVCEKYSLNQDPDSRYVEKYRHEFDFFEDAFRLLLYEDKAILRLEGDIHNLMVKSNGPFDSIILPFFDLVIKSESFGIITNMVLFSIFLSDENRSNPISGFIEKCFNTKFAKKFGEHDDVGITIEERVDDFGVSMQFGPYLGPDDLKRRGLRFNLQADGFQEKYTNKGEMMIVSLSKVTTKFSKEIFHQLIKKIDDKVALVAANS